MENLNQLTGSSDELNIADAEMEMLNFFHDLLAIEEGLCTGEKLVNQTPIEAPGKA